MALSPRRPRRDPSLVSRIPPAKPRDSFFSLPEWARPLHDGRDGVKAWLEGFAESSSQLKAFWGAVGAGRKIPLARFPETIRANVELARGLAQPRGSRWIPAAATGGALLTAAWLTGTGGAKVLDGVDFDRMSVRTSRAPATGRATMELAPEPGYRPLADIPDAYGRGLTREQAVALAKHADGPVTIGDQEYWISHEPGEAGGRNFKTWGWRKNAQGGWDPYLWVEERADGKTQLVVEEWEKGGPGKGVHRDTFVPLDGEGNFDPDGDPERFIRGTRGWKTEVHGAPVPTTSTSPPPPPPAPKAPEPAAWAPPESGVPTGDGGGWFVSDPPTSEPEGGDETWFGGSEVAAAGMGDGWTDDPGEFSGPGWEEPMGPEPVASAGWEDPGAGEGEVATF